MWKHNSRHMWLKRLLPTLIERFSLQWDTHQCRIQDIWWQMLILIVEAKCKSRTTVFTLGATAEILVDSCQQHMQLRVNDTPSMGMCVNVCVCVCLPFRFTGYSLQRSWYSYEWQSQRGRSGAWRLCDLFLWSRLWIARGEQNHLHPSGK